MKIEKKIQGKWLGFHCLDENINVKYGAPAPYFRKKFFLRSTLVHARLKIAALGWFKVYINGIEVTKDEEFLTSWTDYNKRIEYIVYDITKLLQQENAIGIVLGNGWACSSVVWGNAKKYYGVAEPCFLAELSFQYNDGEIETLSTDESWKANVGAIRYNDILYGEYIDCRQSLGDFSKNDYDDSKWYIPIIRESRSALLMEATGPRTKVKERLKVRYLHTVSGKSIYTTDQNLAGLLECKIQGKRGTKITFQYGEILNEDGSLYTENLRGAEATDVYICSGDGMEYFRPLFTYHGFQYIEITIAGEAELSDLVALSIYSDIQKIGEFHCSNDIVNKIYSNACWGLKSNFVNIPTDCPQRDERLGWMGDIGVFARSALYQTDCGEFLKHYLSVIAEATREDGAIPCIAPCPKGFLDDAIGASGWADALFILLSDYYDFYGKKEVVEEYFPLAARFLTWVGNNSLEYRRNTYCFSDWLSVGADLKEGAGDVDFQLFDLCFYAMDCLLMVKFCKLLGKSALEYEEKYKKAKEFFLSNLCVDGKPIGKGRQSALLLAYKAGFLTEQQIKMELLADISNNGMTCGFIGARYILPVLTEIGAQDLAYQLITSTKYPSWGYSVVNGATTVWERWDSYTKDKGVNPNGMNSFNHFAFGSCVEWLYSAVLGIIPLKNNEILIRPIIDKTNIITFAEGNYKGIKVRWETKKNGEKLGCTVHLYIPKDFSWKYDFLDWNIIDMKTHNNEISFILEEKY